MAPSAVASPSSGSLALQVISGKYQGSEYALTPGQEIVLGRGNEVQIVLAEDMVSRRHARIRFQSGQFVIEDLSSTNGTFVNGEKVVTAPLRDGDRVLIGSSILKVVKSGGRKPIPEPVSSRSRINTTMQRRPSAVRSMTGSLQEIPLPDLLQLLGTSRKSGVLVLRSEQNFGRVYLQNGTIQFASINDQTEIAPLKCLVRMLSWNQGQFDLESPEDTTFDEPLDISVHAALMEGMRQVDEYNSLKDSLPSIRSRLRICLPLNAPLRELSAEQLDVFQLIFNYSHFSQVMNRSKVSDLDTARTVLYLIEKGYIRTEFTTGRSIPPAHLGV